MNNPKTLRIVIGFLTLALLVTVAFLIYARYQNSMWRVLIAGLARYAGATSAKEAFQTGKPQLFVFDGVHESDTYSGTNDGPFEIWNSQYFPQDLRYYPFRYTKEQMVEAFNNTMRDLQAHAEKGTNKP